MNKFPRKINKITYYLLNTDVKKEKLLLGKEEKILQMTGSADCSNSAKRSNPQGVHRPQRRKMHRKGRWKISIDNERFSY